MTGGSGPLAMPLCVFEVLVRIELAGTPGVSDYRQDHRYRRYHQQGGSDGEAGEGQPMAEAERLTLGIARPHNHRSDADDNGGSGDPK